MKTIKVSNWLEVPENFTGIVNFPNRIEWYKDGTVHREDGPAIEYPDGSKLWYKDGKHHREDGPAIERQGGTKFWYKDDLKHREDGPAVEFLNGYKEYNLEGKDYDQINLNDYIVLDYYQGNYNLMWYKLLDENKVFEYPDIPGLITK